MSDISVWGGKKPRFSAGYAVAAHLGEDAATIESNRRYQPTRTPCRVYTVDNDYLTATSSPDRKPKEDRDWQWSKIRSPGLVSLAGWQIWRAKR